MPFTEYSSTTSDIVAALVYTGLGSDVTQDGVALSGGVATIPMVLQSYSPPTHTQGLQAQTFIPIRNGTMSSGGSVLTLQGPQFPKITLAGFIDTPLEKVQENDVRDAPHNTYEGADAFIPTIHVAGIPMHWVDVIAMFFEGRYNGARTDPALFRDSYGREFNNVRIWDMSSQAVAGAPGRYNFNMTLVLLRSAI